MFAAIAAIPAPGIEATAANMISEDTFKIIAQINQHEVVSWLTLVGGHAFAPGVGCCSHHLNINNDDCLFRRDRCAVINGPTSESQGWSFSQIFSI